MKRDKLGDNDYKKLEESLALNCKKHFRCNEEAILLGELVNKLPMNEEMLPLYFSILSSTANHAVRNEFAYVLSQFCPQNEELKAIILKLIQSPGTENYRGSLLYALQFLDYTDDESLIVLCSQLVNGNWECRHKAANMLSDSTCKMEPERKTFLENILKSQGEVMGERLDMIEELYDTLIRSTQ